MYRLVILDAHMNVAFETWFQTFEIAKLTYDLNKRYPVVWGGELMLLVDESSEYVDTPIMFSTRL